jgi:ribose-phosphate pyrophosphokinase
MMTQFQQRLSFTPPTVNKGSGLRIFALNATSGLGKAIGEALPGTRNGILKTASTRRVRLIRFATPTSSSCSLHGGPTESANDKLCRLLFFIGALKDAGAARLTAVVPYLCYVRKDRRTEPNDPVSTKYMAGLFEAVGTDVVVTLGVHNPAAFENAFRCRTVTLSAARLFVDYAKMLGPEGFAWCRLIPAGSNARNYSARRCKMPSVGRQERGLPTSIAAPV